MADNNLLKPRPPGWRDAALFGFIEEAWSNSLASFHAYPELAAKLEFIDGLFRRVGGEGGWVDPRNAFSALLFVRSHSAFRMATSLALATPPECYCVMRSCLEYAGYAVRCHDDAELVQAWLNRDESSSSLARVRAAFTHGKIRASIALLNPIASANYDLLYSQSVSWGAHPNEKALSSTMLRRKGPNLTRSLDVVMLPNGGITVSTAMKRVAQTGVLVLELFSLIEAEHFIEKGVADSITMAKSGL